MTLAEVQEAFTGHYGAEARTADLHLTDFTGAGDDVRLGRIVVQGEHGVVLPPAYELARSLTRAENEPGSDDDGIYDADECLVLMVGTEAEYLGALKDPANLDALSDFLYGECVLAPQELLESALGRGQGTPPLPGVYRLDLNTGRVTPPENVEQGNQGGPDATHTDAPDTDAPDALA